MENQSAFTAEDTSRLITAKHATKLVSNYRCCQPEHCGMPNPFQTLEVVRITRSSWIQSPQPSMDLQKMTPNFSRKSSQIHLADLMIPSRYIHQLKSVFGFMKSTKNILSLKNNPFSMFLILELLLCQCLQVRSFVKASTPGFEEDECKTLLKNQEEIFIRVSIYRGRSLTFSVLPNESLTNN